MGKPENKIISRKEALAKGLKRYFTGKPCKRFGHICERTVAGKCTECMKIDYRQSMLDPEKKKLLISRAGIYSSTERGKIKRRAAAKLRYRKDPNSRAIANFKSNLRLKRSRLATPKWENKLLTKKIYKIASDVQKLTGVKMDVDHIIPLKANIVCGLNVWYNLTIIPRYINALKNKNVLPEIDEHLPNKDEWMKYIDNKYSFLCKTFPDQERFELYIKKQKELFEMIMNVKNHKKNPTLHKLYLMFKTSSGGGKTFSNFLMLSPVAY